MPGFVKDIPQTLIYEMVAGKPVYYHGYQEYLNGEKAIEEVMGSSYLQSLIGTQLIIILSRLLDPSIYLILANEIGLKLSKNSWRAADIAIYERAQLKEIPKTNKYLEEAPRIVIEIDTKAQLDEVENPLGYYQEKTDQLLAFGVKKVIWIFTDTEKVMVAEKGKDWQIMDWRKTVSILDDISVNISEIVAGN